MFQTFEAATRPEQGPPRVAALRREMAAAELAGFLVPRADAHQGEYVAPRDARLAWLSGFTGSAGFCAVLGHVAGIFVDGRYRTQVKAQVADCFTPLPWPEVTLAPWLREQLPKGGRIGYDPWLHTAGEIAKTCALLEGSGITLVAGENLVDRIWPDQPGPPMAPVTAHPPEFAGESSEAKRARLAGVLRKAGHRAAVLTLPDSIMWLLNIRGGDIPHNPLAHGFAILHESGRVELFMAEQKLAHLAPPLDSGVVLHEPGAFLAALTDLDGPVRIDAGSVPQIVAETLGERAVAGADPCALPKARKNAAEIAGSIAAHLRDGAALVETLAWIDAQAPGTISEIDVVRRLEQERRKDPALRDISFETIAGTGANGAIIHYRVTEATNAVLDAGDLLVLDSGGQYVDGTTDVTRTIAIGSPGGEERAAFTRVLQGMIAMSRLRWPGGLAGRDIEAIGRMPLWLAGQDFGHGLGHGVGAYLCVHEGPQRLSRASAVAIEPGMILSNEPGYYREGAFGIRIENLLVAERSDPPGAEPGREWLSWRTLTLAPIDRRLILPEMLTEAERGWLDAYHREVAAEIAPRVSPAARDWLAAATAPL